MYPPQSKNTIKPSDTIVFLIIGNVLLAVAGLALIAILVYYSVYMFIDPGIARPWSRNLLYVVGGGLVCTVIASMIGNVVKNARYYPIHGSGQASHTGDMLRSTFVIFVSGLVFTFIMMCVETSVSMFWWMCICYVLLAIATVLYYLVVIRTFSEIKKIP